MGFLVFRNGFSYAGEGSIVWPESSLRFALGSDDEVLRVVEVELERACGGNRAKNRNSRGGNVFASSACLSCILIVGQGATHEALILDMENSKS